MDPRIAIVSLWAEDMPAVVRFYRDVIGLQFMLHHGPQPAFDLGGICLTIVRGRPVPLQDAEPSRFPVVTFAVPDLDAAVERLRRHQVELPWGVGGKEAGRWVMFYDPAGNLIEMAESSTLCIECCQVDVQEQVIDRSRAGGDN